MKISRIEKLKKVQKAKPTNNSFSNAGFSEKDWKEFKKKFWKEKYKQKNSSSGTFAIKGKYNF